MPIIYIQEKNNGFLLRRESEENDEDLGFGKEIVIEGRNPLKMGNEILALFKKPRKSPVRKGAAV